MSAEQTIEQLISDLNSPEAIIRASARDALVSMGPQAVNSLLAALGSDQIRLSAGAITILGEIGNSQVVPPLLEMRSHPHVLLRMNSAQALSKLGDAQIEDILVDWLEKETEILVQIELVNALAAVGGEKTFPTLCTLLAQTQSSTLRYFIIHLLGESGDRRGVAIIRPYLQDPDHHVREHAKAALHKLAAPAKKKISV